MDRRGFLTLLGGAALATPALATTAGGVLVPVPQRIIGDRLVIEDMVLRGITIRNCHIIGDGEGYALDVHDCYVEQVRGNTCMRNCSLAGYDGGAVVNLGMVKVGEALPWK